jgi:hypothetical protein
MIRALGLAMAAATLVGCGLATAFGDLAQTVDDLECPLTAATEGLTPRGARAWPPTPGATIYPAGDAGLVQAWQPIGDGWLVLDFPNATVQSGSIPGIANGSCADYGTYYPSSLDAGCGAADGSLLPCLPPAGYGVEGQLTVLQGGHAQGEELEVEIGNASYETRDGGSVPLPETRLAYVIEGGS